jgi:hypothetical protein
MRQPRPADTLELRTVLYDDLAITHPHLLPDTRHRKRSKDPRIKRTAAHHALTKLLYLMTGGPVSDDDLTLLSIWCEQQRRQNGPKPPDRGRPGEYAKATAICVAYARKAAEAKPGQKESIVAELAAEYGLKRRQVFKIMENIDPDLLLRALADPDPFGWSSDELF